MEPLRADRFTALLAALGLLAAALVLLRGSVWGTGVGTDSVEYVSVARSLLAGEGFTAWNGAVFRDAAPLFPLAIALAGLPGPDPADTAGYVNAAALGLTVLATALWVRSRTRSRFLAAWAGCACALSPALAPLAATAMTDPLFVMFAVFSLFALDRFRDGGGRAFLIAAAACAGLACATRYVGVTLIACALPLLLLPGAALPARARNAAAFAAIAAAPLGAWMLRNLLAAGTPAGRIYPTGFSPLTDLHTAAGEFARWTLGEGGFAHLDALAEALPGAGGDPTAAAAALRAAVPLAAAAAALAMLRRRGCAGEARAAAGGLAVPAAFAGVYALGVAIPLPLADATLFPRYLAPLHPPLLAAAAIVLGALLRCAARRGPFVRPPLPGRAAVPASAPALALAAALALWLPQQAAASLGDIRERRAEGFGYTSRFWDESATVRWLRENPPDGRVRSTNAYALYLLTGMRAERDLRVEAPPVGPGDARRWLGEVRAEGGDAYVVWFHEPAKRRHDYRYGAGELLALPGLEPWAVLEDGLVLRSTRDPPAAGPPAAAVPPAGARLAASADFDVYEDGERLIYVREECAAGDAGAPFFLHVDPLDSGDLPGGRRRYGFDNLDFASADRVFRHEGRCIAMRGLPDYGIAAIRTGQWVRADGSRLWEVEFAPAR